MCVCVCVCKHASVCLSLSVSVYVCVSGCVGSKPQSINLANKIKVHTIPMQKRRFIIYFHQQQQLAVTRAL